MLCSAAASANTVIDYTSQISPDGPCQYAGVANTFALPFLPTMDSVTLGSSGKASASAGEFITDFFGPHNHPSVVSTGIVLTIDPSINGHDYGPVNFMASIINPAHNVFCLDFGPSGNGGNCASGNSSTYVTKSFDNNLYTVDVPTLLEISTSCGLTDVPITFATTVATPEPASMSLVGLVLFGVGYYGVRRRAKAEKQTA